MKKIIILILLFGLGVISNSVTPGIGCKITYIGNEGFLIEYNGKKVILDGLFDTIDSKSFDSPIGEVVERMKKALPPFDSVDLITISHMHRDHFNRDVVLEHLRNNSKARVICPQQVSDILLNNSSMSGLKEQIIGVSPDLYTDKQIKVSGIEVRILRLEHSYYMITDTKTGKRVNKHRQIENIGVVLDLNDLKLFHSGDTNPFNQKEYQTFALNQERIDLAFLERSFFAGGKKTLKIVNELINPKQIILMHIRPGNIRMFRNYFQNNKKIKLFQHKMEMAKY